MSGLLRCGVASVDITPYSYVPGIPLAGFGFNRKATVVHDPIEAVAVHLDDNDTAVTLVCVDLIGLLYPHVDRLRARLRGVGGLVLPCSTHNHAAPDTIGLWGRSFFGLIPLTSGVVGGYMEGLIESLERVVRDAVRAAVPVSVRAARFDVPPDWFRNDRKGGGKDDFGYVVQFLTKEQRTVATLIAFAAHPETLWEHNTLVSADYPGPLRRRVQERLGGIAAFFSGALGGMVTPNVPLSLDLEGRKAAIRRLGEGLADLACEAISNAPSEKVTSLSARSLPLELRLDNWRFRLARALGILDREYVLERVRTEMNLVRIGDVTILTAPGECTPEVGRDLVSAVPGVHRLLFCLGCDEIGYVLTPQQYYNKEYHYERSMSLGPATGPALVRAARDLAAEI